MSSASYDAFPPLWRILGLSVAVGYAGLGSYGLFAPIQSATTYGLRSPDSTLHNDRYVKTSMAWIGARDISIAAALFTFYYEAKPREMGVVILSGAFLCVTDTICVYRARKDMLSISVGAGALIWLWIGWNLLQL